MIGMNCTSPPTLMSIKNSAYFKIMVHFIFIELFGNENIRTIPNIILTLATLIISAIIGVLYSEISNYISLLGGFCCTTYCFFIPGWLMIKVEWNEMSKTKRILSIIGISILTLIGYIGGIMSVIICFRGRK